MISGAVPFAKPLIAILTPGGGIFCKIATRCLIPSKLPHKSNFGPDLKFSNTPPGSLIGRGPHPTPSFFCRLEDEVVYWNTRRLSG